MVIAQHHWISSKTGIQDHIRMHTGREMGKTVVVTVRSRATDGIVWSEAHPHKRKLSQYQITYRKQEQIFLEIRNCLFTSKQSSSMNRILQMRNCQGSQKSHLENKEILDLQMNHGYLLCVSRTSDKSSPICPIFVFYFFMKIGFSPIFFWKIVVLSPVCMANCDFTPFSTL